MEHIARTPKQIGQTVKRFRKLQKRTQTELGSLTNLRQATISSLENGDPGTQLRTLSEVLSALNLELVIRARTSSDDTAMEDIF